MNQLYKSIGISKQAVHKYAKQQVVYDDQVLGLVLKADRLRKEHPGCGVEKMYYALKPDFIGRDRFIETMMGLGYRLKKPRNYKRTTYASGAYYPNLIKGLELTAPSQLWQSDITYIPVGEQFFYGVFIIDVYTKNIVGYHISSNMRATANLQALKMALKNHQAPLIHHSDRGSQYNCKEYTDLLKKEGSKISMSGSAQDNAYAERINRTIKEEYLAYRQISSLEQLRRTVKQAVNQYNNKRPHVSLKMLSPVQFQAIYPSLRKENKPIITIFDNLNNNKLKSVNLI